MYKNFKIIDSHCHIYPDKISRKASDATGNFYGIPMSCDGSVSQLESEGKKAGIDHYIVQSVATTPAQVKSINEFIARTVAENDNMTGLGTLHPESEDIAGDIKHLKELGLKGVKLHPDIQGFKLDDYRCLKMYELCEGKLPFLIHTGDKRYDFSNPNRLKVILETYDNLTVIGAHFGGWSVWEEATKELYQYKNLLVDCSSSLYALSPETATQLVHTYGAERVLFGADYPMWRPNEELERFFKLELSEDEQRKILYENASKLFRITVE